MLLRTWYLAAACGLVAGRASAQSYALDRCHPAREGIGAIQAAGTIRYTLGHDGVPDTGSIAVLSVDGVSVAGYRSVVVRLLSGCKLAHPEAPLSVVQAVRFDTAGAHLTQAITATGAESPIPIGAEPSATVAVLDAKDSTIEEHPSWITCDHPPHTQPPTTSGRSSVADQSMFANASSQNSGSITATIVIGADGRVMKDSLTLVHTTNPANSSNLMRALASCHYAPARIAGVPVPVRMVASILVGANGYSVVAHPVSDVLMGR